MKQSSQGLQLADYEQLAKPTENNPVTYFSTVKPNLYQDIINKFMGSDSHMEKHMNEDMKMNQAMDMEQAMPMPSHSGAGE